MYIDRLSLGPRPRSVLPLLLLLYGICPRVTSFLLLALPAYVSVHTAESQEEESDFYPEETGCLDGS